MRNTSVRRQRRRFVTWITAVGTAGLVWSLGPSRIAEAMNGWTIRLANLTLAEYPPGYGTPNTY